MNWRVAAVFLVAVIFAVAGLAAFFLLPLVPGFGELPRWAQAAAVLGIAWFASAGFGPGTPKRSAAVATACALAGALWVWWSAGAGIPGWEPAPVSAPENVPEGWVPFHFVSAFTYAGEEGDPVLSGLELDLPWPHVGYYSVGIPDNRFGPGSQMWSWKVKGTEEAEHLREVYSGERWEFVAWYDEDAYEYRLEENEVALVLYWERPSVWATYPNELGNNRYSRLVWLRLAIERGDETVLEKRFENGRWVITQGTRFLRFKTVEEPYQDENIMAKALISTLDEEGHPLGSLEPGETVVLEGVFLAPEENENQVRIGDYATEGYGWIPSENRWVRPLKPEENGSPLIAHGGPGAGRIGATKVLIQLSEFDNESWNLIEKFYEEFENVPLNGYTFVDRMV